MLRQRTRGRRRWLPERRRRTASCSRSTWRRATTTPIYGMGRHNHENDVAIPGFDKLVVMSGDDTFTSGPLTIPAGGPLAAGRGRPSPSCTPTRPGTRRPCWPTRATSGRSSRTTPASTTTTTSRRARPQSVIRSLHQGAEEHRHREERGRLRDRRPPTSDIPRRRTTGAGSAISRTNPAVGSTALSGCSSTGASSTTSSTSSASRTSPTTSVPAWGTSCTSSTQAAERNGRQPSTRRSGRRTAGSGRWSSTPTTRRRSTRSASFVEGDDNPVKTFDEIHQPDNIETTQTGLLLTEDPGMQPTVRAADQGLRHATTARLWYVPFSGTPEIVAKVDQSADGDRWTDDSAHVRAGPSQSARATGAPGSRPASSTPRRPSAPARS